MSRRSSLRSFRQNPRAWWSFVFLFSFCFLSFTAELWSNNRPLFLHYQGKNYFPLFRHYSPTLFGQNHALLVDYKELKLSDEDFALWPVNKWGPFEINEKAPYFPSPPTWDNFLGTDESGRDVLARLLYGLRYGMTYALSVWLVSSVMALLIGGMMGHLAGTVDLVGQRVIEILSTIPSLLLLIFLLSMFAPTLPLLIAVSSLLGWMGMSSFVRGEVLRTRKMEYVEAARSLGSGHGRLLLKHLLPNSLISLLTLSPFVITANITGLTALDYLGLGLEPPTPSWGELLQQGHSYFQTAWWLAVFPSLSLFLVLLSLTFIGDGLRMALGPRHS